jgi:hypothetical protein
MTAEETLKTEEQLALELVRQLEIVTIRDPSLAEYVKYVDNAPVGAVNVERKKKWTLIDFFFFLEWFSVVNVMIGNYCTRDVLRELARCLAIFPNLQVFRLDHTARRAFRKLHINQAITYGFGRYKPFPQIRSITIPGACYALQKYFPNAQVFWL